MRESRRTMNSSLRVSLGLCLSSLGLLCAAAAQAHNRTQTVGPRNRPVGAPPGVLIRRPTRWGGACSAGAKTAAGATLAEQPAFDHRLELLGSALKNSLGSHAYAMLAVRKPNFCTQIMSVGTPDANPAAEITRHSR